MPRVGRYVKMTAQAGRGEDLAQLMLRAAELVSDAPGCELYVVNTAVAEPDVVWITEIWASEAAVAESAKVAAATALVQQVISLLDGPLERIDLLPIAGHGLD